WMGQEPFKQKQLEWFNQKRLQVGSLACQHHHRHLLRRRPREDSSASCSSNLPSLRVSWGLCREKPEVNHGQNPSWIHFAAPDPLSRSRSSPCPRFLLPSRD